LTSLATTNSHKARWAGGNGTEHSADSTLPESGQVLDTVEASDGITFIELVFTDLDDGTFTVSAVAQTSECDCVIDGVTTSNITC